MSGLFSKLQYAKKWPIESRVAAHFSHHLNDIGDICRDTGGGVISRFPSSRNMAPLRGWKVDRHNLVQENPLF